MMNFTQVLGNTWVIEGSALMPVYRIDDNRCILLDTGYPSELPELLETLEHHKLTVVCILCSHAHIDHCGNNRYFQETHKIPIAMSAPEAGMCNNILNLKTYRLLASAKLAQEEMSEMVHTPDIIIPSKSETITLMGVPFDIIYTPGHSSGHICTITPDNVCYTADALMSAHMMDSKLPYALSIEDSINSRELLRNLPCALFLMAHKGMCPPEEFDKLIDDNNDLLYRRSGEICAVVTEPISFSELCRRACKALALTSSQPRRILYYERNIRLFVEWLTDRGELIMDSCDQIVIFKGK